MLFALLLSTASAAGLRFEAEDIKGKIQKPEIQILITKQNLTPKYELELRESFLPKVIEAVERKPF